MIYLDNAATTKPYLKCSWILVKDMLFNWFNASSLYKKGEKQQNRIKKYKRIISKKLACNSNEIYFTSGATESNNWVIKGLVLRYLKEHKLDKNFMLPHIITTNIEHHSITNCIKQLVDLGMCQVTYINPEKNGMVLNQNVIREIKPNTILVSMIATNNETGMPNFIKELHKELKKYNILLHTDATQAIGKQEILGNYADFITMSGHKIHAPKGIGLMIGNAFLLEPLIIGGQQQNFQRAGTENVGLIECLAYSISKISKTDGLNISSLKWYATEKLQELFDRDEYIINGDNILSPILSISFKGVEGEYLTSNLSKKGIYLSTGSACNTGDLNPSEVLQAMNVPKNYIGGTIRLSFTNKTEFEDIRRCLIEVRRLIPKDGEE